MNYLDLAAIEAATPNLEEEDFEMSTWGGSVRIKAIMLDDFFEIAETLGMSNPDSATMRERIAFDLAIFRAGVTEPKFTDEHDALLKRCIGDVSACSARIAEMSRLTPGPKSGPRQDDGK